MIGPKTKTAKEDKPVVEVSSSFVLEELMELLNDKEEYRP